jgi:hypothetical protein
VYDLEVEAAAPFRVRYEAQAESITTPAERMAALDDLFETALAMRRARFMREHPSAGVDAANAAVQAWLLEERGGDRDKASVADHEKPVDDTRRNAFLSRTDPR